MIYQGQAGSISIFLKGKIIASQPLRNENSYADMVKESNQLIIDGMRYKVSLKHQIKLHLIHLTETSKWSRNYKTDDEELMVILAMLCLMKLKFFCEEDPANGIFIMPRKRKRRILN